MSWNFMVELAIVKTIIELFQRLSQSAQLKIIKHTVDVTSSREHAFGDYF